MTYTISIIEDDHMLAEQLSRLLSRYDYSCVRTKDFSAITTQIEADQPDLILLDVNLPKYDGFYWCRNLREQTKVPILIMSARNDTADQIRGMESGADDYITKPFDPDVLLAKVNAAIRRSYGELRPGRSSRDGEMCVTFWESQQR
jgi:DNA-binding response OmpR family regulator